jgi:glycosyltransferase involved in cell wall biosynthesis
MSDGAKGPEGGAGGAAPAKRVLFLSAAGMMGGAERSLYELLCALPTDEVEAHACVPAESLLSRLCVLAEVPVHPVPLRRFRRTRHPLILAGQLRALHRGASSIGDLVRDLRLDIIHANTDSTALVAWEVNRETGCPFIWHCRDLRPLGPLAKLLLKKTACAVAISSAVEHHLREEGVPPDRLRRIENGIDIARLHGPDTRPAARARARGYLGVTPETPLLLDIGAWVPWKRHELFLEALGYVRRKYPDATGVLVGSDMFRENAGYVAQLEKLAQKHRLLDGGLLVLQHREDVPDLLAAADVLVSPSENEPFGRVLAEAGAAQVPVVATDSGGKRDVIEDGLTGILVPQGDSAALGEACVRLLDDPPRRERMGHAARARVQLLFDVRRTAREVADLYNEIAQRQGK